MRGDSENQYIKHFILNFTIITSYCEIPAYHHIDDSNQQFSDK